GVASTKACTGQLVAMAALALALGRARGVLSEAQEAARVTELIATPGLLAEALKLEPAVEKIAQKLAQARDALYLGRGTAYPLALEGALKLKELSYIHAEGYAAGELKHGPIALVSWDVPTVAVLGSGTHRTRMLANVREVRARDGLVVAVAAEGDAEAKKVADSVL